MESCFFVFRISVSTISVTGDNTRASRVTESRRLCKVVEQDLWCAAHDGSPRGRRRRSHRRWQLDGEAHGARAGRRHPEQVGYGRFRGHLADHVKRARLLLSLARLSGSSDGRHHGARGVGAMAG